MMNVNNVNIMNVMMINKDNKVKVRILQKKFKNKIKNLLIVLTKVINMILTLDFVHQ